jgi:hypothetical protein
MTFEKHSLLMIPGPTEVSAEALLSMAQPTILHYGDDWVQLHRRVVDKLKRVFRTNNDIFIIPGSSSAAMEAAVTAPTSLYAGLDTSLDAIIAGIGHALRKAGAHARVGDAIDRALQIYNQP